VENPNGFSLSSLNSLLYYHLCENCPLMLVNYKLTYWTLGFLVRAIDSASEILTHDSLTCCLASSYCSLLWMCEGLWLLWEPPVHSITPHWSLITWLLIIPPSAAAAQGGIALSSKNKKESHFSTFRLTLCFSFTLLLPLFESTVVLQDTCSWHSILVLLSGMLLLLQMDCKHKPRRGRRGGLLHNTIVL